MPNTGATPEWLLRQARMATLPRGRLLELYRSYLRVLARTLIGQALRICGSTPPTFLQETYLKAHREFAQFLGGGERELIGWLRRDPGALSPTRPSTTAPEAAICAAKSLCKRRSTDRAWPCRRHCRLGMANGTPVRREEAVLLADALGVCPPDYRDVFILRNLEHMPVEQVAERMGRSVNAVRKLWTRAMLALAQERG